MLGQGRKHEREQDDKRLELWQSRYQRNKRAYQDQLDKMDQREALYMGTAAIKPVAGAANAREASHVRNIVAELIEAQVSSSIPQPKVTALHPEDEPLAKLAEDWLRNELARLPMAYNNDQEERTVLIQGGALSHVEWDATMRTHTTSGELYLGQIHPKQFIPQAGVYTDIEDMDYCFVDIPQTKQYIKDRYGVDLEDMGEERPEARGQETDTTTEEDLVTQHVAYFRNRHGGVGLFSWVWDTVLADMDDYQARRAYLCQKCGQAGDGEECRFCGSTAFRQADQDYEELDRDIVRSDGAVIPARRQELVPTGAPTDAELMGMGMEVFTALAGQIPVAVMREVPTKIPYYKPNVYPVVLRKNVSVFGRLLGDSDVDAVEPQQEAIKKTETKLIDKLFKGGSYLTAGKGTRLETSDKELKILRLDSPAEKSMIDVYNLQPNVTGDFQFLSQVYEEGRQRLGITDAFQGRRDPTATSGVAKEFAARQSAGRLESKRVMKDAYYARLYEVMFKFGLAYADEPRTVVSNDGRGHTQYRVFNRYDFLKQDADGQWYWNDRFLFGVDPAASLSQDREALWQECRLNFQQGCFGEPRELETLVTFWTRMEELHYPGAAEMKTTMEEKLQARQAQMARQLQATTQQTGQPQGMAPGGQASTADMAALLAGQAQNGGTLPMAGELGGVTV